MPTIGLRLKFNAALLALTTIALMGIAWVDYRHESDALMEAHAAHVTMVGSQASAAPIAPWMLPDAAARRSLQMHLALAVTVLLVMAAVVNVAVRFLILRPIDSIRDRLAALQRGQWLGPMGPTGGDELGALDAGFQRLGPEIGALVSQGLRADRLAMLALVSRRLDARIAPDIAAIGEAAARLTRHAPDGVDGQRLGRAAANILRAVHEFDAVFSSDVPGVATADVRARAS